MLIVCDGFITFICVQEITAAMKREKTKGFAEVLVAKDVTEGLSHM